MRTIERFMSRQQITEEERRALLATVTNNKAVALQLDNGSGPRKHLNQAIRVWAHGRHFRCHIKKLAGGELGVWLEPKRG